MTWSTKAPLHLVLARHGESEGNRRGVIQGTTDWPLTDRGRTQARRLGEALASLGLEPDRVYTSHLSRARETAEILADLLGGPRLTVRRALREVHFGRFEGRTTRELWEREPEVMTRVAAGHSLGEFDPPAEDFPRAQARARRVLARLLGDHEAGGAILVVTHGGFKLNLVKALLGIPPGRRVFFSMENCCCSRFRIEGEKVALLALCATAPASP